MIARYDINYETRTYKLSFYLILFSTSLSHHLISLQCLTLFSIYLYFLFLALFFYTNTPIIAIYPNLTNFFSFYLLNRTSLLVKEQARRLKLVDVPRHPWIIHHLAAAAARQASASASQGGGSSAASNGVRK